MKKFKNIAVTVLCGAVLFGLSFWMWFKSSDTFSESERRMLASFPELTMESILSGKFMNGFESYSQDQFPMRDEFRSIKALTAMNVFRHMDNNDIYIVDGYVSKLDYPLNTDSLDNLTARFDYIRKNYLEGTDTNVYLSIIPDKNCFLAEKNGYLSVDYDKLVSTVTEQNDYMKYIDIMDVLSVEDYYRTDSHWRQERLLPVAKKLCDAMNVEFVENYTENTVDSPFYGVYSGQSALDLEPDTIKYLTNDILDGCIVTNYDTGSPVKAEMYNIAATTGRDPYEMFLCGASALVTVENPNAETDRELVVFRDSYSGSLIPLLAGGYSKITLIDTRYIQSAMIGDFVKFDKQDVLFIYSTMLVNNSKILK